MFVRASIPSHLTCSQTGAGTNRIVKQAFDAEGKITDWSEGELHSELGLVTRCCDRRRRSLARYSNSDGAALYVEDVDEVYQRSLKAGATSIQDPIEAHGERLAGVKDLSA